MNTTCVTWSSLLLFVSLMGGAKSQLEIDTNFIAGQTVWLDPNRVELLINKTNPNFRGHDNNECENRIVSTCYVIISWYQDSSLLDNSYKKVCITGTAEECYMSNLPSSIIKEWSGNKPNKALVTLQSYNSGYVMLSGTSRWGPPPPPPLSCTTHGSNIALPSITGGEQSSKHIEATSISVKCNRSGTVRIVVKTPTLDFTQGIKSNVTAPSRLSVGTSYAYVPLTFETVAPNGLLGGTYQGSLVVSVEPE